MFGGGGGTPATGTSGSLFGGGSSNSGGFGTPATPSSGGFFGQQQQTSSAPASGGFGGFASSKYFVFVLFAGM